MSEPFTLIVGEALEQLQQLPDESVHACVTSPPYWRMRDYEHKRQIGLEKTPEAFVAKLVDVFREVRRVLRRDGTLWLNIGDSYACSGKGTTGKTSTLSNPKRQERATLPGRSKTGKGLKRKDLVGIPWMLAFAMRADGWFLRGDIIWAKPNPQPESILDRPTKSHEHVFLFSRAQKYFYDAAAIGEPYKDPAQPMAVSIGPKTMSTDREHLERSTLGTRPTRGWSNARDVWVLPTQGLKEEHFAPMPPELARRCIVAGSPGGGLVLDPFTGAGTTALVALGEGRRFLGIELNEKFARITRRRINGVNLGLGLGGAA